MGQGYALLEDVDLGDIVGASGHVVRTNRGELSLKTDALTMLTKAVRPLPEKWHGLRDPDLQQRRRYLQLATDPEASRFAIARATADGLKQYVAQGGAKRVKPYRVKLDKGGGVPAGCHDPA